MPDGYRVEKWRNSGAPDPVDLRERMEAEGFGTYGWTDRPGAFYGEHEHVNDQSHWVISGRLRLTVKGHGEFELGPGDRDFMPAGTVHSAQVVGDEPVVYLIGERDRMRKG